MKHGRSHRELRARRTDRCGGARRTHQDAAKSPAPAWTSSRRSLRARFRSLACDAVSLPRRTSRAPPKKRRRLSAFASRAGGGVSEERRRAERREHAGADARAVQGARDLSSTWQNGSAILCSHIADGNIHTIRIVYSGRLGRTAIRRSCAMPALAGVLSRSVEYRVNLINAMPLATERGFRVVEQREPGWAEWIPFAWNSRPNQVRSRRWRVGAEQTSSAAGGKYLLRSHARRQPDVLEKRGRAGSDWLSRHLRLGKNGINIANFALGRQDADGASDRKPGTPLTAISIVETDTAVGDAVVKQLFENKAVRSIQLMTFARTH